MTTSDMQAVGRTLLEVLESHLPREQSKLSLIGSAVLEIFYEEFIKFVPAHVLRREEEKNQQLAQQAHGTFLQHQASQ
jgi:hypothetical protein